MFKKKEEETQANSPGTRHAAISRIVT